MDCAVDTKSPFQLQTSMSNYKYWTSMVNYCGDGVCQDNEKLSCVTDCRDHIQEEICKCVTYYLT